MEPEAPPQKLSPGRALTAICSLLSAMLAMALGLYFGPKQGQEYMTVASFAEIPWFSAALMTYGWGSALAFLGIGDPKQPLMPTLRVWVLLLALSALIWFLPLLFAVGRFSWNQSLSISLGIMTLGSLPLFNFKKDKLG